MDKATKVTADQINKVKESLANIALEHLEVGIDLDKLENTVVEFGYIYSRNDSYEALFKVLTDRKTSYFAAQQGNLMHLQDTFNEEMFQGTVQQMEAIHGKWK